MPGTRKNQVMSQLQLRGAIGVRIYHNLDDYMIVWCLYVLKNTLVVVMPGILYVSHVSHNIYIYIQTHTHIRITYVNSHNDYAHRIKKVHQHQVDPCIKWPAASKQYRRKFGNEILKPVAASVVFVPIKGNWDRSGPCELVTLGPSCFHSHWSRGSFPAAAAA